MSDFYHEGISWAAQPKGRGARKKPANFFLVCAFIHWVYNSATLISESRGAMSKFGVLPASADAYLGAVLCFGTACRRSIPVVQGRPAPGLPVRAGVCCNCSTEIRCARWDLQRNYRCGSWVFLRTKSKQTEKPRKFLVRSLICHWTINYKLKIMNALLYFTTNLQESFTSTSSLCVTGIQLAQAYYKHHI